MEHQRQIIDTFVNSVYVFDDRVVLNFNFTDDSKTITREEVLGSSAVDNAPPQSPDLSVWGFFCGGRYRTRTARPRRRRGNQSPSGALISARFPTPRNVYRDDCRFVVAETGSRGWGRVLIFQSPAKGLRKNQQTQPVQAPAVRFRQGSQRLGMSTKKDAARLIRVGSFCFGGRYRTRTGTSKGRVSSWRWYPAFCFDMFYQ